MESSLPPEIQSVFILFSEEEKEGILSKNLDSSSNLADIETVLFELSDELETLSVSFSFLIGRVLYHRGKLDTISVLYEKLKNPGLGLWELLAKLYCGYFTEYFELVERIKSQLADTIFFAFIYYAEAIHGFLTQDYKKYNENRENCLNYYAINIKIHKFGNFDFYKLIQIYMLEMESIYLYTTNILSLARDKTKESLNIIQALNDRICLAQTYNSIGIIELDRGNFQLAHQIFLKGEAIAKEMKMERLLGHLSGSIGDIYLQMGHIDEAMFWYNNGFKIIKEWKNDFRSLYVHYSKFADVYFAKEDFKNAKTEMQKALDILEERHFKDLSIQMKYVEILLYMEDIKEVEAILLKIDKEQKGQLTPTQRSNYWFLLGFLEYKKNNYGDSQQFLQQAMLLADELGHEILSSKTLVLLSIVFLKKYTITMNLEELIEADKCLEDIITYLEEKAKYESLSFIYHIRAKIKIILLDFETALFLLKKGEEFARTYTPLFVDEYNERIEQVKKAIESENDTISDTRIIDFLEDIDTISTILRKESKKLASPREEKPIAVLIFHSSGIPIRTYLSEEVSVSDDLLFGGFISAIRHLMNELFVDQKMKHHILSIDHGQYKLLIEFYSNIFSVVCIALRDSFMLRRKMHRLVEHLSSKGHFGDSYKGDISETESFELDSMIVNLFSIKGTKTT